MSVLIGMAGNFPARWLAASGLLTFFSSSIALGAPATVKVGGHNKPAVATVTKAVVGDRACYVTLKDDRGKMAEEYATFEICEQKPSVVGKRVTLTWKLGEVASQSCGGNPICSRHDRVPLVIGARIASSGKNPVDAVAGSLCTAQESIVFACKTGSKLVSVCADLQAGPGRGYVQYRFGRPGAPEMLLPAGKLPPPKAATGGTESYSGGGSAWLRFRRGSYAYTVFSGIGRWGPKGATRDTAGLLVEQPAGPGRNLKCSGKVTSQLGPAWFKKAGISRKPGESFDIPNP
jgi:hypothetical protein